MSRGNRNGPTPEAAAIGGTLGSQKPVRLPQKSDSVLKTGFRAAGLCRTVNGWAVAVMEVDADGKLVSVDFSESQSFPDPVVGRLKKQQMALNQEALNANPWRPGSG